MKQSFLLIIFFCLISPMSFGQTPPDLENQVKIFQADRVRAFWNIPMGSRLEADQTSIEIQFCKDNSVESCSILIDRIPLSKLRVPGKFSMKLVGEEALLELQNSADAEGQGILIALQTRTLGWFPKVELCAHPRLNTQCRYEIERRQDADGIQLNIFYSR